MKAKPQDDEAAIQALWEALEQGDLEAAQTAIEGEADGEEGEAVAGRIYTEILGALPYELPMVEPSPGRRAALLAHVRRSRARSVLPFRARGAESPTSSSTMARPLRTPHWAQGLAAILALVTVGLGTFAVRQQRELQRFRELAQGLDVEVCPLEPVGEAPLNPRARGAVYVAADHQHWYLAVRGLEPAPRPSVYQLWFFVGDEPVSGGTVELRADGVAELGSPTMPTGTTAMGLTLESQPNAAPEGPTVLYGDQLVPMPL